MKSPSTPNSSNGAPAFERQDLSISFQPRPMDVIIGRGKQVNKHNDKNCILQDLLQTFAGDYLYGKKERKSELLTIVVQEIRATGCAFIKKESPMNLPSTSSSTTGGKPMTRWYSVDETAARNSAAQFLRNHLSENYKSSKQFKKKLRMDKKKATRNASVVSTSSSSSSCDGSPSMISASDNSSSQSSLASCCEQQMPSLPTTSGKTNYTFGDRQTSSNSWKLFEDNYAEQQQTDSLLTLLPPHRGDCYSKSSRRAVSAGTYHSKLLSSTSTSSVLEQEITPLDMDAIMNMDMNCQDLFEPRPIGSGNASFMGDRIFQSMEDEDLFLSLL